MEGLFRSRLARAGLAALLVVVGIWGFAPYVLHDVGTSAYVNAELYRVTTPVAGVLTDRLPQEGAYLTKDQRLQLVTARTPDRSRLDALEQQTALAAASVSLVQAQLAEIAGEDSTLGQRSAIFKTEMLRRLEGHSREAQAQLAACRSRQGEQEEKLVRSQRLAEQGFISKAGLRSAEDAAESARQNCEAARAALDGVAVDSEAARRGVFLSDGSNDAPYAEQQRGRLMLRRQELMSELVRGQSALSQLRSQLSQETGRYARAVNYDAVLPARHLVWNVAARSGSDVGEGQAIMDLADCRDRFVVVELPAGKIEHLNVGDPARIRLLGGDAWINGRVRRITGGAARQDNRLFAADMPKPGAHSFTVEVSFESLESSADGRRSCDIGRTADVRFGGQLPGAGSSSWAALGPPGAL